MSLLFLFSGLNFDLLAFLRLGVLQFFNYIFSCVITQLGELVVRFTECI